MARLPAVFFGHGSPMVALETSDTTRCWAQIAAQVGKPKAILAISAHWLTRGVAVTAMDRPRTIHDFGRSFPDTLFNVQYPAPGDPALAARVRDLLSPLPVHLDGGEWGLDHGTWSVLCKAYPEADVPVVQLSMDAARPPAWHYEIGRRLAPLRDENVLIVGTGNIVHNLRVMSRDGREAPPYDWAVRFNAAIHAAIAADRPEGVIDYAALGRDAELAVADPDHFWPLLYVLGARAPGEPARIFTERFEYRSLSMTGVALGLGDAGAAA
ncbi:MAG TPA: 4,5-DOPA dioxygenase extradiol [Caulobacteraceae bacterium]|nr:4,5-DOPA dioxygenase extradiol [Caulobacteraceae bacterium]